MEMTRPKFLCWLAFLLNFFGPTIPAQLGVRKCHDSGLSGNCESSAGKFRCHDELLANTCVNVANLNLTTLSSSMWTQNVSQIYAYRNRIGIFDLDDPEILTHIDISHNQLKLPPVDILSEARNLIYLNMAHNNLQSISADALGDKTLLKILDLSYNELTNLPEETFSKMKGLERLFLKGNRLSTLPENIFQNCFNLERLNLASNEIKTLVEGTFNKSVNLRSLDLSNNSLKQLPFLGHMPKLYVLDVSKNNLISVAVQELPGLLLFILNNNELSNVDRSMFPKGVQTRKVDLRFNRLKNVNVSILLEFYDPEKNSVLLDENPWSCEAALCPLVQRFPLAHVWFRSDPRCAGPEDMEGKFLDDEEVIRSVCRLNRSKIGAKEVESDSKPEVTNDEYYSLSSTTEAASTYLPLNTHIDYTTYSINTVELESITDVTTDFESNSLSSTTEAASTYLPLNTNSDYTTYSINSVELESITDVTTDLESNSLSSTTEAASTYLPLNANNDSTTNSINEVSGSDTSSSSFTNESMLSDPYTIRTSTEKDDDYPGEVDPS